MYKRTFGVGYVVALALPALLAGQVVAGGDGTRTGSFESKVGAFDGVIDTGVLDIQEIMDAANSSELPSRIVVASIEDTGHRLYLTRILDSVEAAKNANQMTKTELMQLANQVLDRVTALGVGLQAAERDADPANVSCVQNCWNEFEQNAAGRGYWSRFGFALLFELCVADCLVPG